MIILSLWLSIPLTSEKILLSSEALKKFVSAGG